MSNSIADNLIQLKTDKENIQNSLQAKGVLNVSTHGFNDFANDISNIENSYSLSDEGKVVSNGELVSQTSTNITTNGTYNTTLNNSVIIDVPNTYQNEDEGKVVSNGSLISQTSTTVTDNGTIDTTANNEVVVNVPKSGYNNPTYKKMGRCKPISNKYQFYYMPYFKSVTWSGTTSDFNPNYVWTDGTNIYCSIPNYSTYYHYKLDKSTKTWSQYNAWQYTQYNNFTGDNVWSDGSKLYCSSGSSQFVWNKSSSTWTNKTWNGMSSFTGSNIWSDGTNIYYSYHSTNSSYHYVLDKSTSTWSQKTWTGLTIFNGSDIWTDGDNIYFSGYPGYSGTSVTRHYKLNTTTSTWSQISFSGLPSSSYYYGDGSSVWTDGDRIYWSYSISGGNYQYVFDKNNLKWYKNTFCDVYGSEQSFSGTSVWGYGNAIYVNFYQLVKPTITSTTTTTTTFTNTYTSFY